MEANALLPDNLRCVAPDVDHLPDITASDVVAVVDGSAIRLQQTGLSAFKLGGKIHLGYVTFARELAIIAAADPKQGSTVIFPDEDTPLRPLGRAV